LTSHPKSRAVATLSALLLTFIVGINDQARALPPEGASVPGRAPAGGNAATPAVPAAPGPAGSVAAGTTVTQSNIFNDAGQIKMWLAQKPVASAQVTGLLKTYGITDIASTRFLNQIDALKTLDSTSSAPVAPAIVGEAAIPGNLTGSLINAVAGIIAERFKQEAEIIGLQQLIKRMNKVDAQAGHALTEGFPATMAYIKTLDPSSADWNDWSFLQSDFRTDVAALPAHFPSFIDAWYDPSKYSDARYLSLLASTAASNVYSEGRKPYALIDALQAGSAGFTSKAGSSIPQVSKIRDMDVGLDGLVILSHMLTKNGATTWHTADEITQLLETNSAVDPDAVNLLLGLSYAKDRAFYDAIGTWLQAQGKPKLDDIFKTITVQQITIIEGAIKSVVNPFQILATNVNQIPPQLHDIADVLPSITALHDLNDSVADAINTIRSALNVSISTDVSLVKRDIDDVTMEATMVVSFVWDLKSKQYLPAFGEMFTAVSSYVDSKDSGNATQLAEFLRNTGPCVAAIANSASSTDLSSAAEACFVPAAGVPDKQGAAFSVSLNSYFGVAASAETLSGGLAGTGAARTSAHAGFAAPVGLAFNWGQVTHDHKSSACDGFFCTGDWSLFVPVVDLGAVAAWRLGGGTSQVSDITWSNIVAPGLYVVWGQKGSPLTVLFGAQYGPELTKVSTGGGSTIERSALQFPCLEVTFDIPLITLFRRPN
jgi:hypothetical protein